MRLVSVKSVSHIVNLCKVNKFGDLWSIYKTHKRIDDPKLGEADPGGLGACPQKPVLLIA
jgi:hypothetical protein